MFPLPLTNILAEVIPIFACEVVNTIPPFVEEVVTVVGVTLCKTEEVEYPLPKVAST